jgi:hypothetical protein
MRPVGARSIGVLSLAALSAALASSCAAPARTNVDARPSVNSAPPSPARHIAQLDFGRRAVFASCLPPACPAVTPKTLAFEVPPVLATTRPIEPSATPDRGEDRRVEIVIERDAASQ